MEDKSKLTVICDYAGTTDQDHDNLIRHLVHIKEDLGSESDIELVAYGLAISLARRTGSHAKDIKELMRQGLRVSACHKSMQRLSINEADLLEGVPVVPSGLGHIIKRQAAGAIYIKL